MPIYEYQCESCGHQMEALQKMSDPLLTDCPACNKAALRKKVSAAAFRLKGGGWYETDFKTGNKKNVVGDNTGNSSDSNNKPSDAASSSAGSGGDSAATKTTSKPASEGKSASGTSSPA